MQVTHYWMHSMLQVVMKEDKEDWYEEIKIFGSCGLKYLWRFISTQKYIQDYKDNLTQQHHVSFKFDIFPVLLSSYILNKSSILRKWYIWNWYTISLKSNIFAQLVLTHYQIIFMKQKATPNVLHLMHQCSTAWKNTHFINIL